MSYGTQRLIFDTTDATSIASSANVGAWLRDAAGNLLTSTLISGKQSLDTATHLFDGAGTALTSTLVSGKQGLDVNVISAIAVDLDGVYNGSTNTSPDTVGAIFHTRAASPAATDQVERTTAGAASSDAVVAANVHAIDVNSFAMGFNGTTWDRLQVDASKNLKVDIAAADATVTVSDTALANSSIKNTAATIASTSGALLASQLTGRKYLYLANVGNRDVWIGSGTVTSANGFPLNIGAVAELRVGPAVSVQAIAAAGGTPDVRALECA